MSKNPAVLFYTGDFLNGCTDLTMEERGQYVTLLCLQHQKGHLSEKTIKLSVGAVSVDVLKKFTQDEEGNYFHKRMETEIIKRTEFCNHQKINVEQRWKKKNKNTVVSTVVSSTVIPLENENDNDNINRNRNNKEINIDFEIFWNLYDKKRGDKKKLELKWASLSDKEREQIIEYLPRYKKSQPDKSFRKDPQTFFNNKSWNDEIIIPQAKSKFEPEISSKYLNLKT